MYRVAAAEINKGLSLFPRLLLGAASLLCGTIMALVAHQAGKAGYFYVFSAFCVLISIACVSKGRMRQFLGGIIGISLFLLTAAYLAYEIMSGAPLIGSRSQPSIVNSALCLVFFGLPGITYTARTRFGFARQASQTDA